MINKNNNRQLSSRDVLLSLMSQIKPVDFRKIAGLNESDDLRTKHLIVGTIEELLNLANSLKWGLCVRNHFIYVFNGEYWKSIDSSDFKTFLGEVALVMGVNKTDSQFFQFRDSLLKQFLTLANLPAPERSKSTVLINLRNGTYEITPKGHCLREFRREDFLTYQLDFDYNPEGRADIFIQYLNRVLPEGELQIILSEFIAYIFAKNLKLEKCLLLYGQGANGKSVFFEIINALLGKENVSNFSLGNLNEEHNRALIADKLLNYGSEIKASIDRDLFKALVSGEPVQARLKYKDSIIIDDYARLCFNCNELPYDVEHNEAFFRRFIIIPFNETIPEAERDAQLSEKIIANELAGIFNWVISGLTSLLGRGKFSESDIVREMIDSYKKESDSVFQFLNDNGYEPSSTEAIPYMSFFEKYAEYCQKCRCIAVGHKKFGRRIRSHGYNTARVGAGGSTYVYVTKK